MTEEFTIYRMDTGQILSVLINPGYFSVADGQAVAGGRWHYDEYRIEPETGEPVVLPPRPGDWAVFDFDILDWIDPRDPDHDLIAARASATMSRADFLMAAIGAGIIQPSDAGPAARGEVPPSLLSVFESLPDAVQIEALVRWGAATMIERNSPVLAALADAMQITAAQLDALFGIAP